MEDLGCPRCRMTKYRNPSLKLMINACGHPLCEACVDLLFIRESGVCPECKIPLKRNGFRAQLFEDTEVDKEIDVRKNIMKIYNKLETDFPTLREYNDYLEMVEDIVYKLTNNIDVEKTKVDIAKYREENKALIRRNQIQIQQEREFWNEQFEKEKRDSEIRKIMLAKMDEEENLNRKKQYEKFITDLEMNTDLTPEEVLEQHRKLMESEKAESSSMRDAEERMSIGGQDYAKIYANKIEKEEILQYKYKEPETEIFGPNLPDKNEILECGYLKHVRESSDRDLGGGYSSYLACNRALNEAFIGLLWEPKSKHSDLFTLSTGT